MSDRQSQPPIRSRQALVWFGVAAVFDNTHESPYAEGNHKDALALARTKASLCSAPYLGTWCLSARVCLRTRLCHMEPLKTLVIGFNTVNH